MSPASTDTQHVRAVALESVTMPEQERQAVMQLAAFLASDANRPMRQRPALIGPDGEHHELPPSVCTILTQAIPLLVRGEGVTIVPNHTALTTQEAADILNVSRQYVVRLTDEGKLPFTRTGTHRRVRSEDVMAYKTVRDSERRKGLRNLTRMSRELGLYDVTVARSA